MSGSLVWFYILAALSVVSGVLVVANRNPVRSALWLVVNFFVLAAIYLTLSAQFIAVVQVMVYAGAIMVLFLFTIMLLNLGAPSALKERGGLRNLTAVLLSVVFLTALVGAGSLSVGLKRAEPVKSAVTVHNGTVEAIGKALFDPKQMWVLPFELTSIVLLVGIVGSIVLAKRRI